MNNNEIARNNQTLPPAIIEKFLDNQSKEIAIKKDEIELTKQKDIHAFQYATAALAANKEDRESERKLNSEVQLWSYFLTAGITLLIFVFLGFALYLGKDQIALEIVKAIIYIAAGGLGGYTYAKRPKKETS